MIEVEVKARISDLDEIRRKIAKIAQYLGREEKIDDYYTLEKKGKYPLKSLRIRRRKEGYEVNFKRRVSFKDGVYAKDEHEFRINDSDDFIRLINEFGFKKWLRKEKMTYLYEIKSNFHVELNHVKGLGWFVEVEYLTDKEGVKLGRKQVLDVMKKLSISKKKFVKEGYTKLLWNKNN